MKNIILILTLVFTAPTFAETDSWVKVTDDFEISKIIEANPIWSDTVSMVMGGSGGGGTTGAHLFMSEPNSLYNNDHFQKLAITEITSMVHYNRLVSQKIIPENLELNQIYYNNGSSSEVGIFLDDLWIAAKTIELVK
jgi:hypothetical protein